MSMNTPFTALGRNGRSIVTPTCILRCGMSMGPIYPVSCRAVIGFPNTACILNLDRLG